MKSLILISCFLPLLIIYIIMKLSLWISAVNSEKEYVREDAKQEHGPYVANAYADLDEEKKDY
jgi:hypothetical protein